MARDFAGHLPTFLIIGAMKSGTSTLHYLLANHPDISMSRTKETDYFLGPERHQHDLEWYAAQFDPDRPVRGESSPNYTKAMRFGVPERIHAALPNVQLIFSARDPIARIGSHWMHNRAHGRETQNFSQAIRRDPNYVRTSSYARQLAPYVELFGRDKLLIVDARALEEDTAEVVRTVVDFVGARTDLPLDTTKKFHVSSHKTEPAFVHRQIRRLGLSEDGRVSKVASRLPERYLTRHPVARPVIEGRDLAMLKEELAEDAAEFRDLSHMPFDDWQV